MPNLSEFSDLIRLGNLDFALLKPIDTQFLISLTKIEWSTLSNAVFAVGLLAFSIGHLSEPPHLVQWIVYPIYVLCGTAIYYSLMIALSEGISVWLGRNQNLYDFWFYITNFSRYPMEIYEGPIGTPLQTFTFLIPILVVVNVPARTVGRTPLDGQHWPLAGFFALLLATAACLAGSRWMFISALSSYRSASS